MDEHTNEIQKLKLPDRFNYAEAYLTFKCGMGCDYCINKAGDFKNRLEMSVDEWANSLNRIDFNRIPLTLGGGEPTKYPGFYDLVDRLNTPIDLLTNAQFNIEEFIKRVNPDKFSKSDKPFYHPIRVSYHADKMDAETTVKNVKRLQNAGFNVGLFGIRHPHLINENMAMAFMTAKAGVPFYEKDFLGEVDGRMYGFFKYPDSIDGKKHPDVMCRTRELLIAPNGLIHRCHSDLYADRNPVGDIRTSDIEDKFRECSHYGECNPCDVKLKTNRYLKGIECQVEIKK